MSDGENEILLKLTKQNSTLIQFSYVVGSALVALGIWLGVQQMTDQYQSDAIAGLALQVKEASQRQEKTNDTLSRIDERTMSWDKQFSDMKSLMREK